MTLAPCPHCFLKYPDLAQPGRESGRRYLHPTLAMNCLSRRDCDTYICGDCGKAEAMADMAMPPHRDPEVLIEERYVKRDQHGIDAMFRTVVYQDRCEGKRLSPGIPWGPSMTPTSGSVVGADDPYEERCECGSMFFWGWACTECQNIGPAMDALKNDPAFIAKAEQERMQAEAYARAEKERAETLRLNKAVNDYVGYPRKIECCVNCGEASLQNRDDYICLRCRATDELKGNPLLQHVLMKLNERLGNAPAA